MLLHENSESIDNLFSSNVHYRVPRYQRRYVWDETNWDRLWKDISFQLTEAEDNPEHFTGPIITRSIGGIAYEVIDGQQRLATFQIILCVIRDLCETRATRAHIDLAESVAKYIVNDARTIRANADHEFKLVPTRHDRDTFNLVASGKYAQNRADSDKKHCILEAYDYFEKLIRDDYAGKNLDFDKIDCLITCTTRRFSFIDISLSGLDRTPPEKLFASINATGRKLSEFDYLRNDMFLRAENKAKHFYDTYWVFENDSAYWTEDKLDSFLRGVPGSKTGSGLF